MKVLAELKLAIAACALCSCHHNDIILHTDCVSGCDSMIGELTTWQLSNIRMNPFAPVGAEEYRRDENVETWIGQECDVLSVSCFERLGFDCTEQSQQVCFWDGVFIDPDSSEVPVLMLSVKLDFADGIQVSRSGEYTLNGKPAGSFSTEREEVSRFAP